LLTKIGILNSLKLLEYAIPRFILIDSKGNVASADELQPSDIKLIKKLEQLLK
jgi:hypothetical protein